MKFVTIVLILMMAACGGDQGSFREEEAQFVNGLVIYTDPDNGCQYLRARNQGGLTPRLNPDGTQVCGVGK